MSDYQHGSDCSKWWICKIPRSGWIVNRPVPGVGRHAWKFKTGAEALAAFASGHAGEGS